MSWFYAKHGKQEGPVEEEELRSKLGSGELSADDLVWREGMAEWQPAGKIAELAPGAGAGGEPQAGSTLGAGPGVPGGPPPASAAAPPPGSAPSGSAPPGGASGGSVMQEQPQAGIPGLVAPPPTSGLAIASMVCGIISLCFCVFHALVGIPAVVCGHLALKAINESTQAVEGRGMAIAGLVTGYFGIVMSFFWLVLMILPGL